MSYTAGCWVAQNVIGCGSCDGQLVRAHLIPKQRIKREFPHGAYRTVDGSWVNYLPLEAQDSEEQMLCWPYRSLQSILWDERVWVIACGGPTGISGHHGMLDGRSLSVPRSALPEGLEAFAVEYGLVWSLDRDFGLREAVA